MDTSGLLILGFLAFIGLTLVYGKKSTEELERKNAEKLYKKE